jgi:hypothetical protein
VNVVIVFIGFRFFFCCPHTGVPTGFCGSRDIWESRQVSGLTEPVRVVGRAREGHSGWPISWHRKRPLKVLGGWLGARQVTFAMVTSRFGSPSKSERSRGQHLGATSESLRFCVSLFFCRVVAFRKPEGYRFARGKRFSSDVGRQGSGPGGR